MKILLHFPHFPVSPGRFLASAFTRLGHDVRTIGQYYGDNTGWNETPCKREYIHVPHGDKYYRFPDWSPELVVDCDEYARPPKRRPQYKRVPHVMYSASNNVCNILGPFDHGFIALRKGPALPMDDSGRLTWVGCGYDPTLHTPSPIPWEEREYDVCFIGAAWNKRNYLLGLFKSAGLKVYRGMGEMFAEYVAAYHNSRFGLVCAGDYPGPNMRFFETPAMGCLPIIARSTWEQEIDIPALWYVNPDEAVVLVRQYLDSPGNAKALLDRAMAWVQPWTWERVAQKIEDWSRGK